MPLFQRIIRFKMRRMSYSLGYKFSVMDKITTGDKEK
jgi:hypothetical protein